MYNTNYGIILSGVPSMPGSSAQQERYKQYNNHCCWLLGALSKLKRSRLCTGTQECGDFCLIDDPSQP